MEIVVGIMLCISAVEDLRKKEISIWCPLTVSALGIAVRGWEGSLMSPEVWVGVVIGLLFLSMAAVSRGQIGAGDGLILTACGICLGWKRQLVMLLFGMLIFLVVGVIGMLSKRWSGKKPMAFVPYIWIAFITQCFWRG